MTHERDLALTPRMQEAVEEVTRAILRRYPEASFHLSRGMEEPEQVHLWTTVDLEDPDQVLDLILDRLLEIEIDNGIPLYVIPIRTPDRILRDSRSRSHPGHRLHRAVSSSPQQ